MLLKELREQVIKYAQAMVTYNLAQGSQGNISALDRDSGLIAITPTAIEYDAMQPEDICIIDKNGVIVEGKWKSTSETPMHTIFYQRRNDVGAIVHPHPPYSTTFGVILEPIPCILNEASMCIGGAVPIASYQRPGTQELADSGFDTMGDGSAVILAHHGLLTVGANLHLAFEASLAVETTARILIMARSMGAKAHTMDPEEVVILRKMFMEKYHPQAL